MIVEQIPVIAGLSLEQKWLLAVELWNEVENRQGELPTSSAVLEIVAKRFQDHEGDPSAAMTLDDFKRSFYLP